MAIQDEPIKLGFSALEDNPIEQTPSSSNRSQDRESYEAAQASFLDNNLTGNSVLDNYNHYSGVIDKQTELRKLAAQKASRDASDLSEEFVTNPYGDSGSIEETAQAVIQANREVQESGKDPDVQFAETLVGDSIDLQKVKEEAAKSKMYKVLADWQEETSTTDMVMDFAQSFIPFMESYEGYALTGQYFGQEDTIRKAITSFQNLPPEEQASIFPQLKKELEEKVGPVNGINILNNFLQPLGAENPQGFSDAEKVFDAIDAAGVGAPLVMVLRGMKNGHNIAKSAKALGNDDVAVDTSIAAAADPDIARASGMDQTTATGNILPYDISMEDLGHSGGLSGKAFNKLKDFVEEADRTANDIITGNGFLKEGIVNTSQRAQLEVEAEKLLKKEQAENITIKFQDENVTTFEYQILDENNELTTETYDLNLTLNEAGYWEQTSSSLISEYIGSPTAWARGTLREDVDTAQRIDYLSSKINRQLNELTRKAIEPIGLIPTPKNRASLAKVDKALIEGDEFKNADGSRGKVFKPDELRENFALEDNEISAYYRINRLYNNMFNIRNHEKRQEMIAFGYKNVNFTNNGESAAGKVFEQANDAALALNQRNANYVYDVDADELINVRSQGENFYSNNYANGKRIVRLETPYDTGGGRGKVQFAMVHESDITDLPLTVLHRKVGYVPRIYEDAAYFVKEIFEETIDGDKTFHNKKTLRFFSNRKDADAYVEQLVAKAMNEDGLSEAAARAKYKALGDREEEILSAATGDIGHGSGGLYTGARAQDDILYGLEGNKPIRLNSFEALVRNSGNLSKFASMNQWRLGLEQRWKNTANNIFKAKGLDLKVDEFNRLPSISEASDEVRFLNRMYDQIRDWQNFPTAEERAWNTSVQKVYDWAMSNVSKGGLKGYGYKKAGQLVGNLRGADPIATARATAFHSLLGVYNPAQLWVQAQGAMVAASLGFGKYLTRTIGNTIALTSLDAAGKNADSIIKNVARASGNSDTEMKAIFDLWKKTGYRDSVLQTADHAAASKGYGMTRDIYRRLLDGGLVFYRNGELVNRRMSFMTAIERWKEKNPGKLVVSMSDVELRGVMDDANNMMLNMTRANRAQWQKGFLSLPFQFRQVTAKFVETLIGANQNFSRGERGRLLASQFLLYGTAGVPLAGLGTQFLTEVMGMTQKDIEDNPGLVKTLNDGFWGATTFWILDADIELSSRGSLLRGVSELVDSWFVQESTIAEKLLGAFGSTGQRFWDSFTDRIRPFTLGGMQAVNWENSAKLLTSPFLDSLSSYRNLEKAAYMERLNAIYSSNGRLLDTRDYSFMEEWMQRIGFQPSSAAETWDLVQLDKANQSLKRNITEYVMEQMNEFALKHPEGDYSAEEFEEYRNNIQVAMAVLDPMEVKEVNESILQSAKSGSRRAQAVQRYLETMKENTVSDAEEWKAFLLGNKILRLGIESQEED